MKKLFQIYSICLLLIANEVQPLSIPFLSSAMDLIGLVTDISDIVTGRHDLTSGNLFKKKVDPTLAKVNELSDQINALTKEFNVKMDKMMTAVLEDLPRAIQFASLMRKFIDYITRIDELFEDYQYYVNTFGNVTLYTIEDFSRVTTSHRFGDVQDILRHTYHLFIPGQLDQRDESLLDVMTATLMSIKPSERCNQKKSIQQQLYDLYETVVITEIKGFTMASYSYGLLALYQNVSFENEINRASAQTVLRCNQYMTSVSEFLKNLPKEIYMCDPPEHIKGETYIEVNAIRRILIHNYMVSPHGWCASGCPDLNATEYIRQYDYDNVRWRPVSTCPGRMVDCGNLWGVTFCELPNTAEERYTWISHHYGTYGTVDECSAGSKVKLAWWKNNKGNECGTCYCDCSEDHKDSKALRTFSLRPQMADIDNNMVVTGVRFEVKDMMVHVQIEEGKMLPGGSIRKQSQQWKELENFKYLDDVDGGGFVKINGDEEEKMEHGTDYSFIRYGQRDINLDDVYSLEPDYVVTGVKMSRAPDSYKAIQLELYLTSFNFLTGMLTPSEKPSKWINHKNMPNHDRPFGERTNIAIKGEEKSSKFNDNIPSSEDFSVIWFESTEGVKDVGQQTVPFLDKQAVTPYPRIPLAGISLFHRKRKYSAGFIGFKLRTVDLYQYFDPTISPEYLDRYQNNFEFEILNNVVEAE